MPEANAEVPVPAAGEGDRATPDRTASSGGDSSDSTNRIRVRDATQAEMPPQPQGGEQGVSITLDRAESFGALPPTPTLGALSPPGGPVQDPVLTPNNTPPVDASWSEIFASGLAARTLTSTSAQTTAEPRTLPKRQLAKQVANAEDNFRKTTAQVVELASAKTTLEPKRKRGRPSSLLS